MEVKFHYAWKLFVSEWEHALEQIWPHVLAWQRSHTKHASPDMTLTETLCRGGSPSEEEVQDKKSKLVAVLKQHDITVKDTTSTHLWQYYPPFAPNWLRLQEVLLPIEVDGEADPEEPTAENGTHASIASSKQ